MLEGLVLVPRRRRRHEVRAQALEGRAQGRDHVLRRRERVVELVVQAVHEAPDRGVLLGDDQLLLRLLELLVGVVQAVVRLGQAVGFLQALLQRVALDEDRDQVVEAVGEGRELVLGRGRDPGGEVALAHPGNALGELHDRREDLPAEHFVEQEPQPGHDHQREQDQERNAAHEAQHRRAADQGEQQRALELALAGVDRGGELEQVLAVGAGAPELLAAEGQDRGRALLPRLLRQDLVQERGLGVVAGLARGRADPLDHVPVGVVDHGADHAVLLVGAQEVAELLRGPAGLPLGEGQPAAAGEVQGHALPEGLDLLVVDPAQLPPAHDAHDQERERSAGADRRVELGLEAHGQVLGLLYLAPPAAPRGNPCARAVDWTHARPGALPLTAERSAPISVQRPRCPFCTTDVAADERKTACDRCMSWHHSECWSEHGKCAACGHEATSEALRAPPAPRAAAAPRNAAARSGRGLAYGLGMLVGLAFRYRVVVILVVGLLVVLYGILGILPPP
ncbi:MAG: hypothetical protein R3F62_09815 [Planctomycetota bacterium]